MDMGATGEVTMTPYRTRSRRLSARRSREAGIKFFLGGEER
jgi:hypothetical protein